MHATRDIPTVPVERRMELGRLAEARSECPHRVGWTALFLAGYARVARDMPQLRRAFVKFPTPRLVEYPVSTASLAVERTYEGEEGVFVAQLKDPASLSVVQTNDEIRRLQTVPIHECKDFRRILRTASRSVPVRRLAWWLALNVARQRGNYFGTFCLSVYSALGASSLHPISPCTTTLTYGVLDDKSSLDVRIVYDHRVLDGATVARALDSLEVELNGSVADELFEMRRSQSIRFGKPLEWVSAAV